MVTLNMDTSISLYGFSNFNSTNIKKENPVKETNFNNQCKNNPEKLPELTKDHIIYFTSLRSVRKIRSLNRKTLTAVFGHTSEDGKKTDVDSIVSSVALSYLYNQLGYNFKPYFNGKVVSKDIQYVFNRFKDKEKFKGRIPKKLHKINLKKVKSVLVDHNNPMQSAKSFVGKLRIVGIVDHHPRSKEVVLKKGTPVRIEKVGATATIITNMYKEKGVAIPKDIAGLLLSAIVSDTLNFISSTTTVKDREAAQELAGVIWKKVPKEEIPEKIKQLAKGIFKAKNGYKTMPVNELINEDLKKYDNGLVIGQVFPFPYEVVLKRKDEIIKAMHEYEEEKKVTGFILMVTDPIEGLTKLLYTDNTTEIIKKGFKNLKSEKKNVLDIGNKVSRKHDVQPFVT